MATKITSKHDTTVYYPAQPDMSRNQDLAGQTVSSNGYNVTYDSNGYATSAAKSSGGSSGNTITSTKGTSGSSSSGSSGSTSSNKVITDSGSSSTSGNSSANSSQSTAPDGTPMWVIMNNINREAMGMNTINYDAEKGKFLDDNYVPMYSPYLDYGRDDLNPAFVERILSGGNDPTNYQGYTAADPNGSDYYAQYYGMSAEDQALLKLCGEGYNSATNDAARAYWHAQAEKIRAKYGYSGGEDGSGNLPPSSTGSSSSSSTRVPVITKPSGTATQSGTTSGLISGTLPQLPSGTGMSMEDIMALLPEFSPRPLPGNISDYYTGPSTTPALPGSITDYLEQAALSTNAFTPSEPGSYDLSEAIREQAAARMEADLAGLKSAYEKSMAGYDAVAQKLPQSYDTARNSAAAQNALARQAFNEYAAASGLSSGATGQAQLAQSSAYQRSLAGLNQAQADALGEVERNKSDLQREYEFAIAAAEATGNADLASALYQEQIRVQGLEREDAQLAQQMAMLQEQEKWDRATDLWNQAMSQYQMELAQDQELWNRAKDQWNQSLTQYQLGQAQDQAKWDQAVTQL